MPERVIKGVLGLAYATQGNRQTLPPKLKHKLAKPLTFFAPEKIFPRHYQAIKKKLRGIGSV